MLHTVYTHTLSAKQNGIHVKSYIIPLGLKQASVEILNALVHVRACTCTVVHVSAQISHTQPNLRVQ